MQDMTGLDARFLYSETPTAPMHTLKVAVVDVSRRRTPLTEATVAELFGERLDRAPLLRRRAVPIPLHLGHPVWIDDPDFDLRRHLHWRTAAAPGSDRELAAVIAEVASGGLRRDRPLWDLTVVDGLAGDHVAFVVRLHHCLADGGAAVMLLENLFATDEEAHREPARPEPPPPAIDLVGHALAVAPRRAAALPGLARRTLRGLVAARGVRRLAPTTLPKPFAAPRTPLNVSLDRTRTFAMASLPLPALLEARRAASATLNDVFLAACGGALRRYLARRHQLPASSLVAGVPIATHPGEVRYGGNHVDNLMLPIGTDVADPVERVAAVHRASVAARGVREALGTELFEDRAGQTPPLLFPATQWLWTRTGLADRTRPPINLVASNVRGPDALPAVDGGVVTNLYSVGPILEGIGCNITAWSHRDRLEVSVLGCSKSLPDPWELVEDLLASTDELIHALAPAPAPTPPASSPAPAPPGNQTGTAPV